MHRRQFLSISSVGVGIGIAGCIGNSSDDPSPSIQWESGEGHTKAMGGNRIVIFKHVGGDTLNTSEAAIRPIHDDKGHDIERDVSLMNHETGDSYRKDNELILVIPESEPQPEFGESFAIQWTADESEWYTIGEHLWGQNYRPNIDCGKNTDRNQCRG